MPQIPVPLVYAVFFLPFASFLFTACILRPFFNSKPKISGYVTIGAIGLAFVFAVWTLITVSRTGALTLPNVDWVVIGTKTVISLGFMVDSLTAVMLVVVTTVSLMVQIYSQGYMKGDTGYCRYYACMSLFTGSMLGLVMADNLAQVFVFWELVGLCSYLLIGFWFHRPSAARAAMKAFIVTRLGDFGFLAAVLLLYFRAGTLDIEALHGLVVAGVLGGAVLMWAAIGIFAGAVGKSAQFPLHVWLPDAMEGPTPVSALIHAATMVTAGVFLVARTYPLFEHSPEALLTVAIIGAFTAIFAASMGLVATDIKRVLAYCTVSQLGYMMLGLGSGAMVMAMFHLFNHAFAKALLFLGAGSVNHATHTFDMREMGGLRKAMPWTYRTFLIGSISIAGVWPLACFWSKDEIIAQAWEARPVLFWLAMITAFMTAFYMFRVVFLTFGGEYRGAVAQASHSSHASGHGNDEHGSHGLHESSAVMVVPLVILAILSVSSGWVNLGGWFGGLFGEAGHYTWWENLIHVFTRPGLPLISCGVALLGIFVAYAMYSRKWISAERVGKAFHPVYTLLLRKYYFDELYERNIVMRAMINGFFRVLAAFDKNVVDGVVNGVASGTTGVGKGIRRTQTGRLQTYGLAMAIGVCVIVACFYIFK